MRPYARRGSFGRVTGSRVAYVLANRRAPEPDVAFVRQERLDRIQPTRVMGPPDIAVEIVSADSQDRDYHIKRRLYEEAGVSEYWIVDPESQRHQFLRLQNGTFELAPLHQGHIFISEALPGFWLDMAWLRADPLPDELECLQQILVGPPH